MNDSNKVLIFDMDLWSVQVISESNVPYTVTWRDTLHCTRLYLRYGKGLLMYRLISVLIRLLTCRLKPKQVSSEKDGTITSDSDRNDTE